MSRETRQIAVAVYVILAISPGWSRADDMLRTWRAILIVEDARHERIGDGGKAIGPAMMHEIMVDEANRIVGETRWSYAQRYSEAKCYEMYQTIMRHHFPKGTWQDWAGCWNGWLNWRQKPAAVRYTQKVHVAMQYHHPAAK